MVLDSASFAHFWKLEILREVADIDQLHLKAPTHNYILKGQGVITDYIL